MGATTNPSPLKKKRAAATGHEPSSPLCDCAQALTAIKELKAACRVLRAERKVLQKQLAACELARAELETECHERLPNPADTARIAELSKENSELLSELDTCLEALDLRTLEREELREQLEAARNELDALRHYVSDASFCPQDCAECLEEQGCAASCPAFDLCQKRILIVGGIERMETRYRQLIEKEGGVLDYHDGNMQGGVKKLERCLQKADVVLCPVNCNSHGACIMVKKLGKKHNKPVHMMPNFSLHAISSFIAAEASASV